MRNRSNIQRKANSERVWMPKTRRSSENRLTHTNPLTSTADRLVNVTNGCVASDNVNVADAVAIGHRMAAEFQESLPDGLHRPVRAQTRTM